MRPRFVRALWVASYLFAAVQAVAAAPNGGCKFPAGLGDEISKRFPGTRLVTLADLGEYK
jgi:hypothetical protein